MIRESVEDTLRYYADTFCEGFCEGEPEFANFDDDYCSGCRAKRALARIEARSDATPKSGAAEGKSRNSSKRKSHDHTRYT